MEREIRIPRNLPQPSLVQGLPIDQARTVAIYGGLGNLPKRFLAKGFADVGHLFPNINFIVIDKADPRVDSHRIGAEMAKITLPWRAELSYASINELSLNTDRSLTTQNRVVSIDGVITAVPTADHLKITQEWASRGAWVWIEKPITMPAEVPHIRRLADQHPYIAAVDFFLNSDAVIWFLGHLPELLNRIGKVRALHGRLVEKWPIDQELLERPWLLVPTISGGGLGIDLAVHQLSILSVVARHLGLKLKDVEINDVVLGTTHPAHPAETAFWCRGQIAEVTLLCDCGKGVEHTYYGTTILGTKGTIEVFVGTEEMSPYVRVKDPTGTVVYQFEHGQIGYSNTWLDYLILVYGGQIPGLSLRDRLDACSEAVEIVAKAYAWHQRAGKPLLIYRAGDSLAVPHPVLGHAHNTIDNKDNH